MAVSSNYVSSTKSVNIYSKQWDVKEIQEHPTCMYKLCYDGTRIRWSGSFDMLKEFVESAIKLQGKWSSPGGNSKKFTCCSSDITITWYAKKQNTLILHGNATDDANTNDIPANPAAVKVFAEMHEHILENDIQAERYDEEGWNPSLCEYLRKPDCGCQCGMLAAELEEVKLDMLIMNKNIESKISAAINVRENDEIIQLRKNLFNERRK
ncbi:Hypothetical predicted protein, partial [Paramuricea clavata]